MPILITGAASGIGFEFLRRWASEHQCIAVDKTAVPLEKLPEECRRLVKTHVFDLMLPESIQGLAIKLKGVPISCIIHSAGVRGLDPSIHENTPTDVRSAETIEAMDVATMTTTFQINALGSFLLIKHLLPNLKLAANSGQDVKVVVMSSRMGSISGNNSGAGYAYRASKAALNAIIKSFAVDVLDVTFVTVHPGRVETRLVQAKEEGAMSVDESVGDMVQLFDRISRTDTGRFMDRMGEDIPF